MRTLLSDAVAASNTQPWLPESSTSGTGGPPLMRHETDGSRLCQLMGTRTSGDEVCDENFNRAMPDSPSVVRLTVRLCKSASKPCDTGGGGDRGIAQDVST